MSTIYLKYRPQSWEELIGQAHIKLTLQKELEMKKLAHAYLFSGPRGSGKTTTARLLAKSLNCEKRQPEQSEPCNSCGSCQEISGFRSIDVLEIDAASNTGVDNVRENIIDSAKLLPTRSKFKIFIIDEVHMLSTSAFSALLKILEEPPAHVFFILATTEPYKIPATILSRCQRFDFKKVELEKIVERLKMICKKEEVEIEKKVLDQIAHQSEGCLRDAESLLGQILALGEKKITAAEASLVLPRSDFHQVINLLELLVKRNLREGILFLNNLIEEGVDLYHFTEDIIIALRLLMLYKINPDLSKLTFELEEEQLKKFRALSEDISVLETKKILEIFLKQKTLLKSTPVPQLPLEMALIEISQTENSFSQPLKNTPITPKPITANNFPATSKFINKKEEKTENGENNPVIITVEEIRSRWQNFIQKIQNYNHSLPFILKMGEPKEIQGRIVKISFRFALHRDKFNDPKIKALAEKVFNEIFENLNLGLEGYCQETGNLDKTEENKNNEMVANLIKEFGGQVIG